MPANMTHPNKISGDRLIDNFTIAYEAKAQSDGSWNVRVIEPDGTMFDERADSEQQAWHFIIGMVGAALAHAKTKAREAA
jgi:hypothetical protein